MPCFLAWLTKNEAVAVWIEGIALIGIFGFDIWVAIRDHREVIQQLKLAQDQIKISQNAERAWVMTELGSVYQSGKARITAQAGTEGATLIHRHRTVVEVQLTCTNEGRSPAWIDRIHGYGQIINGMDDRLVDRQSETLGTVGPLGPGKVAKTPLEIECDALIQAAQVIRVYIGIEYRDIFGNVRETFLGYIVTGSGDLLRETRMSERNRNT